MSCYPPELTSLLAAFNSHGLKDLDHANLQNRVDSKFLLPLGLLPELLASASQHYSVLQVAGKRISTYFNQYLDTQELGFYHDHHNGKLNRYKVRKRTYLDTQTRFLEVKFKNNQKRTVKSRVQLEDDTEQGEGDFLVSQLGSNYAPLKLAQQGGYRRIALAHESAPERLTLDFDLWYQSSIGSERIELDGFFIAELKQAKRTKNSPFYRLMPHRRITPASFSKYCIGCALLYSDSLKFNRFKPTLMKLKALNEPSHSASLWSL